MLSVETDLLNFDSFDDTICPVDFERAGQITSATVCPLLS
jgi:hypothetical protein